MQAQSTICPICIDDHQPTRECKTADLLIRIESLRAERDRLKEDFAHLMEGAEQYRDDAVRKSLGLRKWKARAEAAERGLAEMRKLHRRICYDGYEKRCELCKTLWPCESVEAARAAGKGE
jgi:hypothetical protein